MSSASSGTLKYTLISYIWKRPVTASRDTLWNVLLAYGCPEKIVSIIKSFYSNFSCIVIHKKLIAGLVQCRERGALRLRPVTHGILSSHIDRVMHKTIGNKRRGIGWTPMSGKFSYQKFFLDIVYRRDWL